MRVRYWTFRKGAGHGDGLRLLFLCVVYVSLSTPRASAECAVLHDPLQSPTEVASAGGVVMGSASFDTAVNGNGVSLFGGGFIDYASAGVASDRGSISLWVRKSAADSAGGIAQIGVIGQPSSLGLFYANDNDLFFEIRTVSDVAAVWVEGALSTTQWRHVAVTWRAGPSGVDFWLFIDARFEGYAFAPGVYSPAESLQIGTTGFYGNGHVRVDELRLFDRNLFDGEVYGDYVFSGNRFQRQPTAKPVSTGPVQLIGKSLFVEGRPFTVKGVGYQPTPIGTPMSSAALQFMYTDPGIIARDMPLLRALNANAIRTWSPLPDETLLDALYNDGVDPIYAIIGFWVNNQGVDFADPAVIAAHQGQFVSLVNQFKDHPAVLAWAIGNEVNLGLDGQTLADWFAMADQLAAAAYLAEGDGYHPSMIVNGHMWGSGDTAFNSDDGSLAFVDVWGHNHYFSNDPDCYFDYYHRISAKPLVLTEFGIDAYDTVHGGEYEAVQAQVNTWQWRWIERMTAGGTVFEYTDEWWKAGAPSSHDLGGYATHMHPDGFSNEEWYGLLRPQAGGSLPDVLTPRAAYHAMALEYAHGPGDYDGDGDMDLRDYAGLQICAGASADGVCGSAFEAEIDGVIDANDYKRLYSCMAGPGLLPTCVVDADCLY